MTLIIKFASDILIELLFDWQVLSCLDVSNLLIHTQNLVQHVGCVLLTLIVNQAQKVWKRIRLLIEILGLPENTFFFATMFDAFFDSLFDQDLPSLQQAEQKVIGPTNLRLREALELSDDISLALVHTKEIVKN